MSGGIGGPFEGVAAAAAVGTLPIGILAGLFLGVTWALAVFVIGWLLLVPVFGMLSNRRGSMDPDEVSRWMDDGERSTDRDPVETLRERYARGELSDSEFEDRLEGLVATEEIPPWAVRENVEDPEAANGEPPVTDASANTEPDRESGGQAESECLRDR